MVEENPEAGLLDGVHVIDLAGEPAAMAGRILADLGADVILAEPASGHPLRALPDRWAAWAAGKHSVVVDGDEDPALVALVRSADIVIDTPGFAGALAVDPALAPDAVWVSVTPFGLTGPRAGWRASDLGVMAASGNMYCTGDPDHEPVRCTEPSGYAHVGAETAFAALTGLASGRPQRIDLSMQEAVFVANLSTPARFPATGFRGTRRGANIGRTREIWPTRDGFVSFGLRGGKARVPSLETLTGLVGTPTLRAMDWTTFAPNTADDETLRAIEADVAAFFARHTMQELYDIACETNLMLAPINSPREILASAQLAAREFFGPLGGYEQLPMAFVTIESADGRAARSRPRAPAPVLGEATVALRDAATSASPAARGDASSAWAGTKILEFGSGAAGPVATRYFVEHGATVLRVESKGRPDFLRVYALGPNNPHGLEGAPMFDGLNVGKRDVTFNLKHPGAVELVKRLVVEWADAVAENFAPRAMRRFGLDYASLATEKPDLVMVSACLNGQTGPHRHYPGFGGQGSALAGYNFLTGWPDREPVGPHATITDSLAPRFVATALAAGLLYRRRTGRGVHLDVSQVEAAIYSLSPWLLEYQRTGHAQERAGNSNDRARFHAVLACVDEPVDDALVGDRWVAVAAWDDAEHERLMELTDGDPTAFASTRTRVEVAEVLQAVGIEAVPVLDFGDVHSDPQVAHREHFVALTHPFMGDGLYERNGFRLSDGPSTYDRAGPTLGQDQDRVLHDLLGIDAEEAAELAADGVFD